MRTFLSQEGSVRDYSDLRCDLGVSHYLDGADVNGIHDFNPLWIAEFRKTNAFEVWNRITDPMLFDIVEARSVWDLFVMEWVRFAECFPALTDIPA